MLSNPRDISKISKNSNTFHKMTEIEGVGLGVCPALAQNSWIFWKFWKSIDISKISKISKNSNTFLQDPGNRHGGDGAHFQHRAKTVGNFGNFGNFGNVGNPLIFPKFPKFPILFTRSRKSTGWAWGIFPA